MTCCIRKSAHPTCNDQVLDEMLQTATGRPDKVRFGIELALRKRRHLGRQERASARCPEYDLLAKKDSNFRLNLSYFLVKPSIRPADLGQLNTHHCLFVH